MIFQLLLIHYFNINPPKVDYIPSGLDFNFNVGKIRFLYAPISDHRLNFHFQVARVLKLTPKFLKAIKENSNNEHI